MAIDNKKRPGTGKRTVAPAGKPTFVLVEFEDGSEDLVAEGVDHADDEMMGADLDLIASHFVTVSSNGRRGTPVTRE